RFTSVDDTDYIVIEVEGIGLTRATGGEPRLGRRRRQFIHLGSIKPEGISKREGSRRNVPISDHVTGGIYSVSDTAVTTSGQGGPAQVILRNQGSISRVNAESVLLGC